ncbi:hypothetical protein E8E11_010684 [Didymella keratinophila]|nr:hypothetical protein E8E11_010684 [Didymella keratinophila]
MRAPQQIGEPEATSHSETPVSSSSTNTIPNEASPAFDAPPPMPPLPYFKTHFIKPSSFKTAINNKVDNSLVSLFRLSVRVLQLIFALASGISYAIELRHGNGRGEASGSFVFSQVAFGATLLTLIINGVTVRYYRLSWMVDWILTVFWFALFAVFYKVYLGGDMTPAYGGVNTGRMTRAVWCNLINALLQAIIRKRRSRSLAPVNLTNIVVYQPWDDLGIHFFMSNYVGKDPAVSQLHYLPDFYGKLGYATSSLKKTIIASGLAGYARTARRQDLIEQSTRTYVAAIQDINTALSSPQHAVNDTTLMSIMMAAMFETMLVSPESGMHNTSKHLEGAMSVAYLSLQQRPPSDVFKALLSTLVQSVIMNCWIQHVPLPARYKSIRPAGAEYSNLRLQRSASESLTIVLAEEICATVPQLLSYADYLNQFVDSTEFALPTRSRSPDQSERSMASSSSNHTKPASENSGSGSNASTPQTVDASSPQSTSTSSSYASNQDASKTYTAKIPLFTPGTLDPASAFHLLLKLHNLILVPWLPFAMKSWIRGRISWIEANSDPYSARRLGAMIRKRPCDGFPVSNTAGQIPFGGICETIALTPADQRLWFLAHSWLFVGIDWNANYYSEASDP